MKRYIVIVFAAVVTSCGIYKPYERPEVATGGLYGAEYVETDTVSVAQLGWEEFFTDEELQGLIRYGLEHNTDMQAAHWRIEEAEAALKSARLAYLPSFNLAPNGGVSSFDGSKASWTYTAPLSASWQIDIFGGITNAKRRAKAVYAESEEYQQAVRVQLISAIANYYYTLLMLDGQHEATRLVAASLDSSAETMRALMEGGMANAAGVAQIEAAAYDAHATLLEIEHSIMAVESSLCALLGDAPHSIARGTLDEQQMPAELSIGVPVSLLSRRPDVRMAEYRLMQAHYATAAARSQLYPTLTLSGLLGWTNNVGSIVTNPGGLILSAAASLTAPIFNSGKLRAQVRIAEAQREEVMLAFEQSLLNAGSEVNTALSQVQTARQKLQLRTSQVEALAKAAEATQLLMDYGSTTYLEVLTAQQSLLAGQIAAISDRFDEIQGCLNLYIALGGGSEREESREQDK